MKKFILSIAVIALVSMTAYSQSIVEEVDYFQSIFGMAKKELIANFVDVEEPGAVAFWTLYDEYELKRRDLGKVRLDLLASYAQNYLTMDATVTNELILAMVTQKKNLDKLIVKYYKKMRKSAGVKPAAQFYQLENYVLSALRLEILESIPFIGEI